jgi:hypothetical protein
VHDIIDVVVVFLETQFAKSHPDALEFRYGIRISHHETIHGIQFLGGNLALLFSLKAGDPVLEMGHPLARILIEIADGRRHRKKDRLWFIVRRLAAEAADAVLGLDHKLGRRTALAPPVPERAGVAGDVFRKNDHVLGFSDERKDADAVVHPLLACVAWINGTGGVDQQGNWSQQDSDDDHD